MIQEYLRSAKMLRKRVFNFTIGAGILGLIAGLIYIFILIRNGEKDSYGVIADWITFALALSGFYLLISRFNAQQKINDRTLSKYSRDKIEQQFFKFLDLHNGNIVHLRGKTVGTDKGRRSGINILRTIKIKFDIFYSIFELLNIIDVDEDVWLNKPANYIQVLQNALKNNKKEIKSMVSYLDDQRSEIYDHSFYQIMSEVLNVYKNPRNYIFRKEALPGAIYITIFLGSNESTMKWIEEEFDRETVDSFRIICKHLSIPAYGYQDSLSSFFKVFYNAVNYIDSQPSEDLPYKEKYKYVKMLRGQMTTLELTLFFYNLLSDFGKVWERLDEERDPMLVSKYNLLKNIPEDYCAFGLEPKNLFPEICYDGRNSSVEDKRRHFERFDKLDREYFGKRKV